MSPALSPGFAAILLDWYRHHQRRLPWRGDSNPYRVWLSEVMLQQTRVETVMPYYRRWLRRFPTIGTVASATEEQLLKVWEGLGYYRRARLFHQACGRIVADHNGRFPADPGAFRRLPGVGPYTYAAVRSICFGDPLPAVDGNLKRVVARLLAAPLTGPALLKLAEEALTPAMQTQPAGEMNQALMDLGATVCTPREPLCHQCPLAGMCVAYQMGQVSDFPRRVARKPIPRIPVAVGAVWRGDQLLICRRPSEGLLGGLWELPGGKVEAGESPAKAVRREILEEVGLTVEVGPLAGSVRHAYTHFAITLDAFHCTSLHGDPQPLGCSQVRWIRWTDLPRFPFPRANHKLFPLIEQSRPRAAAAA